MLTGENKNIKLSSKIYPWMSGMVWVELLLFTLIVCIKSVLLNKMISVQYSNFVFIISSIGSALVLASISMWFKRKTRIKILFALDIVLSLIMISDMVYYRYFNDVISVPVLRQAVLMDTLQSSILDLFKLSDILFAVDIIIFIPVLIILGKKKMISDHTTVKRRIVATLGVLIVGVCCVSYGFIRINKSMGSSIFTFVLDRTYFVQNIGIVNCHGFDIYSTISKSFSKDGGIPEEEKQQIVQSFKTLQDPISDKKLTGIAKDYNLIVVQAEAFQNMLIDMKVNGVEVTPNLNKFAKKSAYFKNYFAQTAQGGTSDAEFLSNVSYYPLTEGSVYFRYPNNTFDTLPKKMKKLGYKTVAMHAYKGSYWNRSSAYPAVGFDQFINMPDYKIDERVGWGLSDTSFLKQSIDKLEEIGEPFYGFLITLSAHYPYDAFDKEKNFNVAPYENTFIGNYLKAQHYADQALGVFFQQLEKSGLMDKSVIVIYGDHAGIQKDKTADYKEFLNLNNNAELRGMQMTKVPLIVHFPGDREAGVREVAGGQLDFYPTIANLYGVQSEYALGKDLFNTDEGYAIFRDGSVTDGKTAYIKSANECFDLVTGEKSDINKFKDKIEMAAKQLELSDNVLRYNLIKEFMKENSK